MRSERGRSRWSPAAHRAPGSTRPRGSGRRSASTARRCRGTRRSPPRIGRRPSVRPPRSSSPPGSAGEQGSTRSLTSLISTNPSTSARGIDADGHDRGEPLAVLASQWSARAPPWPLSMTPSTNARIAPELLLGPVRQRGHGADELLLGEAGHRADHLVDPDDAGRRARSARGRRGSSRGRPRGRRRAHVASGAGAGSRRPPAGTGRVVAGSAGSCARRRGGGLAGHNATPSGWVPRGLGPNRIR